MLRRPRTPRAPRAAPSPPRALSRRDALATAVAAATPCLCAVCALQTAPGRAAYQRYFASSMAGPIMAQYEASVADAKASLFERARQLARATDRRRLDVLDVGVGAAPNARFFGAGDVSSYVGLDPNPAMAPFATAAAAAAGWGGRFAFARGGAADAAAALAPHTADAKCDVVVMTLVLCSVPDVAAAVAAATTVLRPGGVLAFHEHVAADAAARPVLALGQRVLEPLQRALADGCHLTRDPEPVVRAAAGVSVIDVRAFDVEGAGLIAPHKQGVVVRV